MYLPIKSARALKSGLLSSYAAMKYIYKKETDLTITTVITMATARALGHQKRPMAINVTKQMVEPPMVHHAETTRHRSRRDAQFASALSILFIRRVESRRPQYNGTEGECVLQLLAIKMLNRTMHTWNMPERLHGKSQSAALPKIIHINRECRSTSGWWSIMTISARICLARNNPSSRQILSWESSDFAGAV